MTSSNSHSHDSLPPSPSRIQTPSNRTPSSEDGSASFQMSFPEINQHIDVEKEVTQFVKELDANEGREECVFRTKVLKYPIADVGNHYSTNLLSESETSRDSDGEGNSTPTSTNNNKRDNVASLKMTHCAFKATSTAKKNGIPVSLLAGNLERQESRYPSFLGSRSSVSMTGAPTAGSVRALQRINPSRKGAAELVSPAPSPPVMELIRTLEEQKKKAESEGNYMEARIVAQRLNGVKVLEENKRKMVMLERHGKEKAAAKRACKQETSERNRLWDEKLHKFHKGVVEHAAKLKRQQIGVVQAFRQRMAAKSPTKPQWSRELLKQRKVQTFLGKQGKYLEADEVSRIADRMEHMELQATLAAYATEVAVKEAALRAKQQNEMEVLLQRAAQGRDELRKTRNLDLERCARRHKNIAKDLRTLQLQELVKCEQILEKRVSEFKRSGGSLQMLSDTLRDLSSLALPGIPDCPEGDEATSSSHGSDSH